MSIPIMPSKCPGLNLYIDGFTALRRPKTLQDANITHIVSAVDWKFPSDSPMIKGFQHFHIPLDDVYDSNILEYFPRSNAFIEEGLNYWNKEPGPDLSTTTLLDDDSGKPRQSGVLVHCAMGISRSATIVLAYLLWRSRQPQTTETNSSDMISLPPTPLTVDAALALLREGRPRVEPNSGFMKQLRMYVEMGCPTTQTELESHKIYRRWMNSRNVMEALSVNQAPELEHITWRDEEDDDGNYDEDGDNDDDINTGLRRREGKESSADPEITDPDITTSDPQPSRATKAEIDIKCRKCRRLVAKSNFIIPHRPPPHRDPNNESCAHIFLHPLSWMKSTLSEGAMDGRLICPNERCGANIGKFAWQGLRCSCGGWVTPGFGVGKAKIDEVPVGRRRPAGGLVAGIRGLNVNGNGGSPGEAANSGGYVAPHGTQTHQHHPAVRLPPGMKRGAGGNL